jgi:hypothetical protein
MLEFRLEEQDHLTAIRAVQQRLLRGASRPGWRPFVIRLLIWMCIGAAISLLFQGRGQQLVTWGPLLFIALLLVQILWQQRRVLALAARSQSRDYCLAIAPTGLDIRTTDEHLQIPWSAMAPAERTPSHLVLHWNSFKALAIPYAALGDEVQREAFLAALCQYLDVVATPTAAVAVTPSTPASWGRMLLDNIFAGTLLLAFRPAATARLRSGVPQLLGLLGAEILLILGGDLLREGLPGQLHPAGIAAFIAGIPWVLLSAWATAAFAGKGEKFLPGAIALCALGFVSNLLWQLLGLVPEAGWQALGKGASLLYPILLVWVALASIVALCRLHGLANEQRLGAVLAVLLLLILPTLALYGGDGRIWIGIGREESDTEAEEDQQRQRWQAATREAMLYRQPQLLQQALARVSTGTIGRPELYFVGVAGNASQDVFAREVQSTAQLLGQRFDNASRQVLLINNPDTLETYPAASRTALEQVLQGIGQRMNREEDILFLFLTSHGSADHRFDLSLWPYDFPGLTPAALKELLDGAGVRHRVIVVSACYSGGFIAPLAGPDTLVIAASRADRNSHGCSHEADWTFFGQAYINEALRQGLGFEAAFHQARQQVALREQQEKLTPSEPQMAMGDNIRARLQALETAAQ